MKIISTIATAILCCLIPVSTIYAQGEQSQPGRRYLNDVFTQFERTGNIVYGQAVNHVSDKTEQLTLRLFEPKGDKLAKRPLFILTPGGGFVKHEDHWMDEFGEQLARAGYVVAINRYRLTDSINSAEKYVDALLMAMTDQKTAIRFFVKDAQGKNRYRIDPDNIFIGGHSAGAITSMHVAYLNEKDEVDEVFKQGIKNNGGLTGKDKVPFHIRGVINMSGLITDLNILDAGEPALMSMHGDKDQVVPIGAAATGTQGSIPIHERAQSIGLVNELHIIRGALHNDPSDPELCPECVPLTKRFMFETMAHDSGKVHQP